jgi:heat-inducible transcriptional repressor
VLIGEQVFEELSDRQKFLLTLVIHEYIRLAAPVGSSHLVERYHLEMSSATVRNELAALTERGYLRQPHTSAGRIPSEEGYRYFVSRLVHEKDLPDPTRRMISHQFYQSKNDVDEWMRLAASVLASQSRAVSLVTAPHPEKARFKHLELIATRGRQVLMVLVLAGGELHQRMISLAEAVPQEHLSDAAARLTHLLAEKDADAIRPAMNQMNELELDLATYLLEEMEQANHLSAGTVYLDGISNVLAEPEFSGSEEARRPLRLLEDEETLKDMISRTLQGSSVGMVQVLIGGEGTWDDLRQCSLVLARYGAPGLATGSLGVIGPMRMSYGHTISTVRFLSGLLTDLVSESLGDDNTEFAR